MVEMDIEKIVRMVDFSKMSYDGVLVVPAVAQCVETGKVLMQAYMNDEALRKTLETRIATYWSRSKNGLWIKGETSGSYQEVRELYLDCDYDSVLLKVRQLGTEGACHKKDRYGCFDNGRVL